MKSDGCMFPEALDFMDGTSSMHKSTTTADNVCVDKKEGERRESRKAIPLSVILVELISSIVFIM